ncbi:MAG: multicopper oxidase domain-containing protein [Pseudomonadota bacterium]|nr:multicopper oxidase domain-containing protein [Pseudomonadota bacterium]
MHRSHAMPEQAEPKMQAKAPHSGHSHSNMHSAHHGEKMHETSSHYDAKNAVKISTLDKAVSQQLDYKQLRSRQAVRHSGEIQEFTLRLTGDMENYNWSFNDLPLSAADVIKIDRGKVVRFHFINETMMNHPMHLHGHFFKVLSGNGDHDVIKHTVNVDPMASTTIEFTANEHKDWLFHCHNLYHSKSGMARVVRYSDYAGNPAFMKAKMASNEIMDTDAYFRTDIRAYSQHAGLLWRVSNAKHRLELGAEQHYEKNHPELSATYLYRLSPWLQLSAGIEREEQENEGQFGLQWVTPFDIDTHFWITDEGEVNASAETEFQLTPRFAIELGADTEEAWEATLEYRQSPYWGVGINVNDTSGLGAGVELTF